MRPVQLTVTGVGVSSPIPLDRMLNPFNVGLSIDVGAGCTYTVEYTNDDVFAVTFNPATALWFPHPNLTAQTTDGIGNIAFPVTAVRLNQTVGAAATVFRVTQSGSIS